MLFNSFGFIFVFLPVALAGFFAIPVRCRDARKVWLCLTSLFFYGYWKIEYVPLLLFSMAFNYTAAELIHRWRGQPAQNRVLAAGVLVNLLLLGYYKYATFIANSFGAVLRQEVWQFDIILPLAISFFTFTQIGYLVDVSRDPQLHYRPLDYALFVVFFPHLIAGPIIRHWEVIPQFADRELRSRRSDLAVGVALFLMGLYKKILLADPVSHYADAVYGAATMGRPISWFDGWFGTTAYALQIYFDFSGYSDMAIGLARMFGIKFPFNFDSPYRAGSIGEFWRRWHMSLTRFLKDYVYIPLGGNRHGQWKQARNIVITFFLSGLWHGAAWTFVLWGTLHGAMVAISTWWGRFRQHRGWRGAHWSYRGSAVLVTFAAVVLTFVLFRAPNFGTAGQMLTSMAGARGLTMSQEVTNPERLPGRLLAAVGVRFVPDTCGIQKYGQALQLVLLLLVVVWGLPNTQQLLRSYDPGLADSIRPARWSLPLNWATGLVLGVVFLGVVRSHFSVAASPFLYFNF